MKRLSPEEAKQKVLARLRRSNRPTLIGHIALELDWSLADAERFMHDLARDGVIRRLTGREMEDFDVRDGFLPV